MFDTVTLSHQVNRPLGARQLIAAGFTQNIVIQPDGVKRERFYRNPADDEGYGPRITYYATSGYLVSEASLPKLIFGNNVAMMGDGDLPLAFEALDDHVGEVLHLPLPPSGDWNVARADFCYNFQVGDTLPVYLSALSRLQVSRHNRRPVNLETVEFYAKANRIKFYDKFAESRLEEARGLLRYEVSVFDTRYASKHWLKCDRVASKVLSERNAVHILRYFLNRLGINDKPIAALAQIVQNLYDGYGQKMAPQLFWFMALYSLYGDRTHKMGLMARSTFFRYKKILRDEGLMTFNDSGAELPALTIPDSLE